MLLRPLQTRPCIGWDLILDTVSVVSEANRFGFEPRFNCSERFPRFALYAAQDAAACWHLSLKSPLAGLHLEALPALPGELVQHAWDSEKEGRKALSSKGDEALRAWLSSAAKRPIQQLLLDDEIASELRAARQVNPRATTVGLVILRASCPNRFRALAFYMRQGQRYNRS